MRRILTLSLLGVLLVAGIAGSQQHYQGCHIRTATPTVCRVGPGVFYAVTINSKGASGNYTYIWDTATVISATVPIVVLDSTAGPLTVTYNMMVTNGVTIWNTSGTLADLTVLTE